MASAVDQYSSSHPNQEVSPIFDPTSATSISFFQASRAPVAVARETKDSSRRTHGGYRGMCSNPVDPGGEVRGRSVGCILGIPEISHSVFIAAASRYMDF